MRHEYREGYRSPQWARTHRVDPSKHAPAIKMLFLYELKDDDGSLYNRWIAIGTRRIADKLGITRRRVMVTLDHLVQKGTLERRVTRSGPNNIWITEYRFRRGDER